MKRPKSALPFTILTERDKVHIVAGEDYRYTFSAPALETWLPKLLEAADGSVTIDDLLTRHVDPSFRSSAFTLIERMFGERVFVDGSALDAHEPKRLTATVEGSGPLAERLRALVSSPGDVDTMCIFCQDTLDYAAALEAGRRHRRQGRRWIWVSSAPLRRGYVSPLFLPRAGPCFACLLTLFRRISPAPDLYEALTEHGQQGGVFRTVELPDHATTILAMLLQWKIEQAALDEPSPALYRLHVLELDSMEVTVHRVLVDPDCPHAAEDHS